MRPLILLLTLLLLPYTLVFAQYPDEYNVVWDSPSAGSGQSMPCGGGGVGMNVWVEQGIVYFYFSHSGAFDENNAFLKGGRIRLELSPNPFLSGYFRQELKLKEGCIEITAGQGKDKTVVELWADVFRPVIHIEVKSQVKRSVKAGYESWRQEDFLLRPNESHANSYKFAPPEGLKITKDSIRFDRDGVTFYHRNPAVTVFDATVERQRMSSVKEQLMNPLAQLTFGGRMAGRNFVEDDTYTGTYQGTDYKGWALKSRTPANNHQLNIYLHNRQTASVRAWEEQMEGLISENIAVHKKAKADSRAWWKAFWERSFIRISGSDKQAWAIGRNYQLFRHMLGCNAYGSEPTKFNGGLFTFDPVFVDTARAFTPDFRLWGGGTMTAQNQRLVYFPLIKSGDFDMLPSQFNFYLRMLKNAELRSQVYWGHAGACFTEQIENFGLPNISENEWQPRRPGADMGVESNPWLEYCWDTALEFGLMMLDASDYTGTSATPYLPFIESVLTFFDEHYRYLASRRGTHELDGDGHLVLYPGSGCETYKMATNATSTVVALETIVKRLLALPDAEITEAQRANWNRLLNSIPPISFREINGKRLIAPAKTWERINNEEVPQLYPVYPWRIYGVDRPDLQVAVDTYFNDPEALRFRSHVGWKQDNIFAACLGLREEAKRLTVLKLQDGLHRYPAFWGPGFDWTPDHNWGGSGMIGLQEMLLQTEGDRILLFPAWPAGWDVHFKLHAPQQTTVEVVLEKGEIKHLQVTPKEREKDISIRLEAEDVSK